MRWEGYQIRIPERVPHFSLALYAGSGGPHCCFDFLLLSRRNWPAVLNFGRSPHMEPVRLSRLSILSRSLKVISESAVVHSNFREGGTCFASFMDPIRNNLCSPVPRA